MSIEAQSVVIIGGSSGIGLAIAKDAVDAGADAIIAGRSQSKLDAARQEIAGDVATRTVDVSDQESVAKWLPPNGFTGKVHHLDAKVGGTYKMSFTNFTTCKRHSFGGTYLELTPHERIRYTDKFDAPNLPGEMQTTITLKQVFCGTELNITQEGLSAAIPIEACYLGWQESLTLLAKLVEAEIPDQM